MRSHVLALLLAACGPAITHREPAAASAENRAPEPAVAIAEPSSDEGCISAADRARVACGDAEPAPTMTEAEVEARLEADRSRRGGPLPEDTSFISELRAWRCQTGEARRVYLEGRAHWSAERWAEAAILFELATGDAELAGYAFDLELDALNRLSAERACGTEMEGVVVRALETRCRAPIADAESCERWEAVRAALAARQ